MESTAYDQGNGNDNYSPVAQMPSNGPRQGLESKVEQMLTVKDVAGILRVTPRFVRDGLDGLPEQLKDVRGDGSYLVRTYYLSDVVSFLEKARGQPLPDGPLEPLLTIKEVAERFHVTPSTVRKWSNKGILHAYELGPHNVRYDPGDVKALAGKLTTNEVAEMLHVNPNTVRSWGNKGILHAYELGPHTFRYDRGDVEALAGKLTPKEVAEILHVHYNTIIRWRNKGILPAYQLGLHTFRYDRGEVEALAEKRGITIDSKLSQN